MESGLLFVGSLQSIEDRSKLRFDARAGGFGGVDGLLPFGAIGLQLELLVLRDAFEIADAGALHRVRLFARFAGLVVADQSVGAFPQRVVSLIGLPLDDGGTFAQVTRCGGECPLDAWASIIVARVAYKHIRKRRTERKLFVLDRGDVPDVVDRAAAGTVQIRSAIRCVEKYLRGMDVNKAWTFVLHDVHGYDLEEVSAITGVSRAAAQSRLVRGRKALHERIAKDPELSSLLSDLSHKGEA